MAGGRVTALFADISGFTSLAETMAPDELHEIIEPAIAGMAAVAERRGGYIAKYAGDALLVFFGVPEERDDDARRAVDAALAMHSELVECVRTLPGDAAGLTLHIGVATGHVAGEGGAGYAILGDAVTLAQKLESAAGSGETFVDETTRGLAGDVFAFEAVEGGAVPAWRVSGGAGRTTPAPARPAPSGERAPEEYRLVTSLFADVAGAAELAARLDAAELQATIGPIIKRLAVVADGFSGTTAKYAGDSLLVFFGAPVAQEDHAERALLVALAMHREMEKIVRTLPEHAGTLRLRIGVNTGRAISGLFGGDIRSDYSVLGDAVNLAQRLEAAAPPGETYVGEPTMRLTEARFALEPVGALRLKGKRQPVPTWRLAGERAAGPALRAAAPLIGRDEELATAGRLLERLAGGTGGMLVVTGEPGVGKSRLLAEVRERAAAAGVRWLDARCVSYGAVLAYWPYADLLRRFAGIEPSDRDPAGRLRDALEAAGAGDAAPLLARLIGTRLADRDEEIEALDAEAFRRALHAAIASFVRALAAAGPVVLAVEDVHWADASSLEATSDVAPLCESAPVGIVLTGRPEAREPAGRAGAALEPGRRHELALGPLGADGIAALVWWMLAGEPPPALLDAVAARTGGNPFFAEEIVRELRDAGILVAADEGWRLREGWDAGSVPATVEGVLSARIDLLAARDAEILQIASVIGRSVRLPLLRAVAEANGDLDDALGALVEGGFFDPAAERGEQALMFHHVLVLDVAYARLPRRRKRALHRRVAEAGERIYGTGDDVIDLLARHLYLAGGGPKAVEYSVRAGRRAGKLFANDEAIGHLSRALEMARTDAADRLAEILLELGHLYDLGGRYDSAEESYREARELGGDARAWRGLAAALRKRGEIPGALAELDRAFSVAGVGWDLASLWLERGWILSVTGAYAEGIEALRRGIDSAGSRRDGIVAQLQLEYARVETERGFAEEALRHAREATSIFDALGDLGGKAKALRVVGGALHEIGRLDESADTLREGLALAEKTGNAEELAACLVNLGLVEQARGRIEDAIECDLRAAKEAERIGHASGRAIVYGNLAEKLLYAGRLDEAADYCRRSRDLANEINDVPIFAWSLEVEALILAARDDVEGALEKAREAARLFLDNDDPKAAARSLETAAEILERGGDAERASALRGEARSLLER